MILDEIEKRVIEKEEFLLEQTKHIKDMHENLNYLIEYKCLIVKAS